MRHEITTSERRKGGKSQGILNSENGHMRTIGAIEAIRQKQEKVGLYALTPEQRSEHAKYSGTMGAHMQWHVNRCMKNPDCEFCRTGQVYIRSQRGKRVTE